MLHIVLFQPQIPQNTGNVVRTCAVTGSRLTLIAPLGFSVHDRWLKRAGLDYWEGVRVEVKESLDMILEEHAPHIFLFSSKASKYHYEVSYPSDALLVFGSETEGLPPGLFDKWNSHAVKIPMLEGARCLNLATSVGIGVYEALRSQYSGK